MCTSDKFKSHHYILLDECKCGVKGPPLRELCACKPWPLVYLDASMHFLTFGKNNIGYLGLFLMQIAGNTGVMM